MVVAVKVKQGERGSEGRKRHAHVGVWQQRLLVLLLVRGGCGLHFVLALTAQSALQQCLPAS